MRQACFLLSLLTLSHVAPAVCRADRTSFIPLKALKVETSEIAVEQHNDMSKPADYNRHTRIRCTDKVTGHVLFDVTTPQLTTLWIAPDSQYIVGLSSIKLRNPYQLVVLDKAGHIVFEQHMAASEASLTPAQYQQFEKRYPAAAKQTQTWTVRDSKRVYVDYERMDSPRLLGEGAWNYLYQHRHASHFSPNISESVTNFVNWYDADKPDLKLDTADGRPTVLSLRDLKGQRIFLSIPPIANQPKAQQ